MKPIKKFEEYLENGIVTKIEPDQNRSDSLFQNSSQRLRFLIEMVDKMKITELSANSIVENSYDCLMELIRAIMYQEGLSSSGKGAHEAEVSFAWKLGISEHDARYLDSLRYRRNGILYYGRRCSEKYAEETKDFAERLFKILSKKLREDKTDA